MKGRFEIEEFFGASDSQSDDSDDSSPRGSHKSRRASHKHAKWLVRVAGSALNALQDRSHPGSATDRSHPGGTVYRSHPGSTTDRSYPGGTADRSHPGGTPESSYPGGIADQPRDPEPEIQNEILNLRERLLVLRQSGDADE